MSVISVQERALIDAAISRGMVRVIPLGVSGLPYPEPDKADIAARAREGTVRTRNDARAIKDHEMAQIADLRAKGAGMREIAKIIGRSLGAIHRAITSLRAEERVAA